LIWPIILQLEQVGYAKANVHQYTTIDFCLDEIGRIDWVCHLTALKELTIANNSVTEIEVKPPKLICLGHRQM
jgi:hypothetical protein